MKLGCTLLTTLMANPDGVRYLATDDEFLPQIVKGFRQLDPVSLFIFPKIGDFTDKMIALWPKYCARLRPDFLEETS